MPETPRRRPRRSRVTLAAVCALLLVLALAATELVLVAVAPPDDTDGRLLMWPPDGRFGFVPREEVFPGLSGAVTFETNELGLRADPWPQGGADVAVLAIGGSTTACTYVDQQDMWTQVLQRRLRASSGREVWVGNAGKDGLSTRSHVYQMDLLLPQLPPIDVVIVLAGVNDMLTRLTRHHEYDPRSLERPDALERMLLLTFTRRSAKEWLDESPWYHDLRLWQIADAWRNRAYWDERHNDERGDMMELRRRHRRKARKLSELPDLTDGLAEYRRNLELIVDVAEREGVRLVLMTQPSIYERGLERELERLLWLGGIGQFSEVKPVEFYDTAAMAEAMDAYNLEMQMVAERRGVECLDLAACLPRDLSVYYDDVHFNVSGADRVAQAVYEYLRDDPLFTAPRGGRPVRGSEPPEPREPR